MRCALGIICSNASERGRLRPRVCRGQRQFRKTPSCQKSPPSHDNHDRKPTASPSNGREQTSALTPTVLLLGGVRGGFVQPQRQNHGHHRRSRQPRRGDRVSVSTSWRKNGAGG